MCFLTSYHVCVKSNLRVIGAMHDCQIDGGEKYIMFLED